MKREVGQGARSQNVCNLLPVLASSDGGEWRLGGSLYRSAVRRLGMHGRRHILLIMLRWRRGGTAPAYSASSARKGSPTKPASRRRRWVSGRTPGVCAVCEPCDTRGMNTRKGTEFGAYGPGMILHCFRADEEGARDFPVRHSLGDQALLRCRRAASHIFADHRLGYLWRDHATAARYSRNNPGDVLGGGVLEQDPGCTHGRYSVNIARVATIDVTADNNFRVRFFGGYGKEFGHVVSVTGPHLLFPRKGDAGGRVGRIGRT